MPTYEYTSAFLRRYRRLPVAKRKRFERAVSEFVSDIGNMESGERTGFRRGLRVKKVVGRQGVYEMTWDSDGRAIFSWGTTKRPDKLHVIWLDIGGHEILP